MKPKRKTFKLLVDKIPPALIRRSTFYLEDNLDFLQAECSWIPVQYTALSEAPMSRSLLTHAASDACPASLFIDQLLRLQSRLWEGSLLPPCCARFVAQQIPSV